MDRNCKNYLQKKPNKLHTWELLFDAMGERYERWPMTKPVGRII